MEGNPHCQTEVGSNISQPQSRSPWFLHRSYLPTYHHDPLVEPASRMWLGNGAVPHIGGHSGVLGHFLQLPDLPHTMHTQCPHLEGLSLLTEWLSPQSLAPGLVLSTKKRFQNQSISQ